MAIRALDYAVGELACRGLLAEPDGGRPRPGVLVVPEAPGLGEHPRRRIQMLSELGFVALAADIFGGGAPVLSGPPMFERIKPLQQDRAELRRRGLGALDALRALPSVDSGRIAAIGYCFGGSTVIELARAGTVLNGVASFHGALDTPSPAEPGAIRTRMLVCTGSQDPLVPVEHRLAAEAEFAAGGADWQMIVYGGAKHSFTNSDTPQSPQFGYDPAADRRSWQALTDFFGEIFA